VKLTGARVTVLGKHAEKLALVKKTGVRTILLDDWKPRLFDVVVEATGSESGLKLAMSAVRTRGALVLKSTIAGEHNISLAPLVINEITVVGSRCGPFQRALQALAEKTISVTPLIERIYPLAEGLDAVIDATRPAVRKILLRP
jgi:threonine dehydrogenase-like Zn-dependent dehydrogenase